MSSALPQGVVQVMPQLEYRHRPVAVPQEIIRIRHAALGNVQPLGNAQPPGNLLLHEGLVGNAVAFVAEPAFTGQILQAGILRRRVLEIQRLQIQHTDSFPGYRASISRTAWAACARGATCSWRVFMSRSFTTPWASSSSPRVAVRGAPVLLANLNCAFRLRPQ